MTKRETVQAYDTRNNEITRMAVSAFEADASGRYRVAGEKDIAKAKLKSDVVAARTALMTAQEEGSKKAIDAAVVELAKARKRHAA